ncbi:MAG TPA: PilX N-terminal domain-containing pilus assembly protein [Rhodanobacteraceae bacterium]
MTVAQPVASQSHLGMHPICRAQRGAALFVALILLIVITLVGLAAISTTLLQNRAAANQYDRSVAFQAAEAALRQGQVAIQNMTGSVGMPVPQATLTSAGFEDCSSVYNTPPTKCLADPFSDPNSTGYIVTVKPAEFNAGPVAAMQPQYVVQYLGQFLAPTASVRQLSNAQHYGNSTQGQLVDYYRITARSGDPKKVGDRSIVTLQSTFRN